MSDYFHFLAIGDDATREHLTCAVLGGEKQSNCFEVLVMKDEQWK